MSRLAILIHDVQSTRKSEKNYLGRQDGFSSKSIKSFFQIISIINGEIMISSPSINRSAPIAIYKGPVLLVIRKVRK